MGTGKDLWSQFETLFNKGDFDGLASLFSMDAIYTDPAGRHEGREAIRAWFNEMAQVFSEERTEASLVIEQGDVVVAEWTYRSIHTGSLTMPDGTEVPGTGKPMEQPGVTIGEIRDGRFSAAREYFDLLIGMQQLGLMPSG